MKRWTLALCALLLLSGSAWWWQVANAATNITGYKDTISTSAPGQAANHTLSFTLQTAVAPGAYLEVTPPAEFETLSTSTFSARNVELIVNGVARTAATTSAPGIDVVDITGGTPGSIRYTLHPGAGLPADSTIELLIGNHTSGSLESEELFSTSTGTTTTPADIRPIINASSTGTHEVILEIYEGASLVAEAGFLIAIIEQVGVGPADTRETIPPDRFNGLPDQPVGGTTPFVEISLETNEFSICRWSDVPDTSYADMANTFDTPGHPFMDPFHIFHTDIVPVTPGTLAQFFVRCVDEEGNINIDDFVIAFQVNDQPTGQANEEGDVDGDGSGTGNDGSGDGAGSGGETGQASGETPLEGGSSGSGGSGGGGGGGGGNRSGSTAGGGFESTDAPFRSGDGRVTITGLAYPRADVTFNVDGQRVDIVRADASGAYEVTLDGIARGVYTFGIFATGGNSVPSSVYSTSFTVTGARTSALSNVNIPPSILVEPDPVDPGQPLTFSGFALANATVTLEYRRTGATGQTVTAQSDATGRWSVTLQTAGLTTGTYEVRAKAERGLTQTGFSQPTFFGVGQTADVPINADLNRDGRVNLTDFSILLFWWNSDGGTSDPPADINRDGRVNLTDFSILLFNWTG